MTKRATVTEADMKRAIKAASNCGLTVDECIMTPDEVRLIFSGRPPKANPPGNNPAKPKEWQ